MTTMLDNTSNQYETMCSHINDLVTYIEDIKLLRDEYATNFKLSKDTREELIAYFNDEQESLEEELKLHKEALVKLKKKVFSS